MHKLTFGPSVPPPLLWPQAKKNAAKKSLLGLVAEQNPKQIKVLLQSMAPSANGGGGGGEYKVLGGGDYKVVSGGEYKPLNGKIGAGHATTDEEMGLHLTANGISSRPQPQ